MRMKIVSAVLAAGLLLTGASGTASLVLAHDKGGPHHGGPPRADAQKLTGTIAGVSGGTITLNLTGGGTQVVKTDASTQYVANGQKATSPPASGTAVTILAVKQTDGSLLAKLVLSGTLPGRGTEHEGQDVDVNGTIAGFSGSSFTVTTSSGPVVVLYDATTKFALNGAASTAAAALKSGQTVRVGANKQANGSLLATRVMVGTPGQGPRPAHGNGVHARGTVASYSAGGISVTTAQGVVAFVFDAHTVFVINGAKVARPATLTGQVGVEGVKQSNGTNLAKLVIQGAKAKPKKKK